MPEGTIHLEHFYLETHVPEPLENPFGTTCYLMFPGCIEGGWCAQGDDFRTFLGDLVAAFQQIELPAGMNL